MMVFQKEQIILLREHINEIIALLEKYDTLHTAQFRPTLTMMARNIEQCINNQFEGIEELSKYIFEDWRIACVGEYGIDNWYLDIQDLICKQEVNKEILKITPHSVSFFQKIKCPTCSKEDVFVIQRESIKNYPVKWMKIDVENI